MPCPLQLNLDKQQAIIKNMRDEHTIAKEKNLLTSPDFTTKFENLKKQLNEAKDEYKVLQAENIGSFIDEQEHDITNIGARMSTPPSPTTEPPTTEPTNITLKNKFNNTRTLSLNRRYDSNDYNKIFDNYMRGYTNALRTDDDSSAGYFVTPTKFLAGIIREVEDQTYISALARTFIIEDAGSLSARRRTAKVNAFNYGSEVHSILDNEDSSLAFGVRRLEPRYITGAIKLSRDLVRMATIDMEALITEEFSYDLANFLENAYLTGNGSGQPLGVLTPSTLGISTSRDSAAIDADVASGEDSTTHFGFNSLLRAIYTLKPQYRNKARWMLHRDSVFRTATIRDTAGQYIWQPSKAVGEPATICGIPYDESEYMPNTYTAGQYYALLCDWRHYYITIGMRLEMQRLNEIAARTNQYEYHMRMKVDAAPVLEEAFVRCKLAAS